MLPTITNNIESSCTFLDLPEDVITPYLRIQDARNCSLVCDQLYKNFHKHHLNLPEDVLHHIFIFLSLKDLKNCSLACRQLGRAIHKDSFWQRKSYQDFFPLHKPMSPYKEWYPFALCRESEKTSHLSMSSHCYTLQNSSGMPVSYQTFFAFTPRGRCLPDPDHVWMLEKAESEEPNPLQNPSDIFLVGKNAFLYALIREAAAGHDDAYTSMYTPPLLGGTSIYHNICKTPPREKVADVIASASGKKQWALEIDNYIITVAFNALPQEAKNQVYRKLFEIMQPPVHYWGWGEDAFHDKNGLSSTDQQKIAAIQSYVTSSTSNSSDDAHYFKMLQFFHLSPEQRTIVYKELYLSVFPRASYWGWGEDAFHDKNGVSSTKKQKAWAIKYCYYKLFYN